MAYISGTYGLKFYKELTNERGVTVRLEIHQRSWSGRTIEIAKLSGLNFFIQGSQDDVDTPIVKTSAKFGLLDNPFEPGLDSDGEKYVNGHWVRFTNWTEFYTPDSTLYLVKLFHNGRALWSGYITPDSYQESLDAFGVIQITARDNLGHLQDFEFDMTGDTYGLVNIYNLVEAAFNKINFPMNAVYQDQADDNELRSEDDAIGVRDLCVNVSAFDGMNWYEALEETLNSVGWCMRFCDVNAFEVGPLRHIARYGWHMEDDQPSENVQFIGRGSGTRTYDPAYREIVETIDFGQNDDVAPDLMCAKSGSVTVGSDNFISVFDQDIVNPYGQTSHQTSYLSRSAPYITGRTGFNWQGWEMLPVSLISENYTLQDYTKQTEGESANDYVYIAANVGTLTQSGPNWTSVNHSFGRKVRSTALKLVLKLAPHPAGFDENGKLGVYPFNLKFIKYSVWYRKDNSTVRYWNGNYWQQGYVALTEEHDPLTESADTLEVQLLECQELGTYGTLYLTIEQIVYQSTSYWWTSAGGQIQLMIQASIGVYARVESLTFESSQSTKMRSDKVTTVVNTKNNVRCKRTPLFGCLSQTCGFIMPENYENAFYYIDGDGNVQQAPYKWKWLTDTVSLPFPAKIHQQLLMFHYSTKQVLEGASRPCDYERAGHDGELRFDCTIGYKGVQHLLMSVNHDLLTDRFVATILRDFNGYGALWTGSETQSSSGQLQ